jgi:hypothetical protein
MSHQGINDLDIQIAIKDVFSTICPELFFSVPHVNPVMLIDSSIHTEPSLRVGFISTHFFNHSIGRMLIALIIRLKEMRLQYSAKSIDINIQIFVYFVDRSVSANLSLNSIIDYESANYSFHDQVTDILRKNLGNNYVRVPDDINIVRSVIEKDKLDFLLFTDIGMELSSYLMAYSRLATYQVLSL